MPRKRALAFTMIMLAAAAFTATQASAQGRLMVGSAGGEAGAPRGVKMEIWRVASGGERKLAHRDGGAAVTAEGLDLAEGTYEIYVEDQETGLILKLGEGKDVKVRKGAVARVEIAELSRRVTEVKEKDEAERKAKTDLLKSRRGKRSTFAVGEGAAETSVSEPQEELHAPGELLVKFRPDTTLADRYAVMQELDAESRSKLVPLDVYRVKVNDAADLAALIHAHADDPRIKYMEMNMVVSVPEPVEESQ